MKIADDHVEVGTVTPPSDYEKTVGHTGQHGYGDVPPDPDAALSEEEKRHNDRKLLRKIDLRLIPWLSLLYLASFLDRTNIGNARLDGLVTDLNLVGGDYYASLSIFFISYALAEPITNILLKRMRPSIFLPLTMVFWGICMTLMGIVSNYAGLLACRFFLGLCEAGLFPGINYYLSCWYKREELGIRAAIFFSAAAVAGSFGGLLAAALSLMKGVGGKDGWSWIFIIEGLATIVLAVASFWVIQDFPDEATFLNPDDRARVLRRLHVDKQSSARHEDFSWFPVRQAFADWKTWMYMLIYMGCDVPLYAFSLFLPTIVANLGNSGVRAQLLTVPPYAAAAVLTVAIGFIADRTKQRGLCNMGVACLGVIGFSMLVANVNARISYAGTFLGAMGIYPCVANTITWAANNSEGVYKRGVVIGLVIGWGNLNGVVSSNIYTPGVRTGHAIVLAYLIVFLLGGSALQYTLLRRENAKRLAGKRDVWAQGKSEKEIETLGDNRPDFIYTL